MAILAIVRHGQSQWNLENRFTGNVDIELTPLGQEEAKKAGRLLKSYLFSEAHTSVLKRAFHTLEVILAEINDPSLKVIKSAELNERNYGDLQGLNKAAIQEQYGLDQFNKWRRAYEEIPPNGESLAGTYARVIPYYKEKIEPLLKEDKNILIVAHGNSLRALMMYLENIGPKEIENIDLATGKPRIYEFEGTMSLSKVYYPE